MDIGFSPFATRPAEVEPADDWLGGARDSSLPLDGPVGTPAFPVQLMAADDLLPPAEDSHEETRATLSPEARSEAMGEAYELYTEGLGGTDTEAGSGDDDRALGEGDISGGDGGHAQGALTPVTDLLDDDVDLEADSGNDPADSGDSPDDVPRDDAGDSPVDSPDDGVDSMDAPAEDSNTEQRATISEEPADAIHATAATDDVADIMDAPASDTLTESRATISEEPDEIDDGTPTIDVGGTDGVADTMDVSAGDSVAEGRATIADDDSGIDDDGSDMLGAVGGVAVATGMDATAEDSVTEGRATISEDPAADDGDSARIEVAEIDDVADMIDISAADSVAEDSTGDEGDSDALDVAGAGELADSMDAPAEDSVCENRATIDPVQAKSSHMTGSASDIQSAAAKGVQGSGGRLPHLDVIQRSFGAHDVSGVRSHVGGHAAHAAGAIGASAYATGNNVAFADSPDLFTAAHEAAHVVQQRAGVQLLGGIGEVGDVYEQNADEVAGAVVRGGAAAHLLGAETTHAAQPPSGGAHIQKRPASGSTRGEQTSGTGRSAPTAAGSAAYHIDDARDLALKGFRLFGRLNQLVSSYWRAANSLSYGRTSSAVRKLSRLARRLQRAASRAQMLALSDPLLPPEKQSEQAGVLALIDSLEQSVDSIPGAIGSQLGLNKFGGGIAATGPRGIWRASRSILAAVQVGRNIATLVKGERNVDGLQPHRKNQISAAYESLGTGAEKLFVKHALQHLGPNLWQQVAGIRGADHKTLTTHAAGAADAISGGTPGTVAGIFARLDQARAAFLKPDYARCGALLREAQRGLIAIATEERFNGIAADVGGDRVLFDYAMGTPQLVGLLLQYVASTAGGPGRAGPWDAVASKIKGPARQALEVLAGEVRHKDASHLTATKDATETTASVVIGAVAVPVGLLAVLQGPVVAAEIALTAGEGASAWSALIALAGRNPEFALALSEIAVGMGIEIADVGVGSFLDSLTSGSGILGLLADAFGAHHSRIAYRGTGTGPATATPGKPKSGSRAMRAAKATLQKHLAKLRAFKKAAAQKHRQLASKMADLLSPEMVTPDGTRVRLTGDSDVDAGTTYQSRRHDEGGQSTGETTSPAQTQQHEQDHNKRTSDGVDKIDQPLENPHPNASPEGHMHADHGAHTTDAQQAHRVETGVAPSGRTTANPPRSATGFRSPESELEAVARARRRLAVDNPATLRQDGTPGRHGVIVETQDPRGFASGVHVARRAPSGRPATRADGTRIAEYQPEVLRRARVVFEWVPTTNRWEVLTGYPTSAR